MIKKKLFQKLVMATMIVSFIGGQASTAFASCASDKNDCDTRAGNTFNSCIRSAGDSFKSAVYACLIVAILNPPAGLICEAAALAKSNIDVRSCNNNYDSDEAKCQANYNNCHDPVPPGA